MFKTNAYAFRSGAAPYSDWLNGGAGTAAPAVQTAPPPGAVAPPSTTPAPQPAPVQPGPAVTAPTPPIAEPVYNPAGRAMPTQSRATFANARQRRPFMYDQLSGVPTDPGMAGAYYQEGLRSRTPFSRPGLNKGFRTWLSGRR
jgi:hypothetical protein